MLQKAPIAYRYDGTLNGLLCCIFTCFEQKQLPQALLSPATEQLTLFSAYTVETDDVRAQRVSKGICANICEDMLDMLHDALLCRDEGTDLAALEVACLGFDVGPSVLDMLAEPCIDHLMKALRHAWYEAHLLKGFVRFQAFGGALIATIAPKNRALPLIAPHFCERFAQETFMIYDEVHKEALVHQRGRTGIYPIENYEPPPKEAPERQIASLWQQYFKAIAIQSRENPTCQRGHMPKRYWAHMLETHEDVCYNTSKPLGGQRDDTALPSQAHA